MGSTLVRFTVQTFPPLRVIGGSVRIKLDAGFDDPTIENLWKRIKSDGSLVDLESLQNRATPEPDLVGWMGDWQPGDDAYTYLAGMLFAANTPVPEGFTGRDIPAGEMAIGWIAETADEEGGDIHAGASAYLAAAMREHGYEYDGARGGFEMECYTQERFRAAEQQGGQVILDFITPCKQRS
jgi:predicted transcriptional regulator YdeE